eukprot:tig00000980_g6144.t1
MRSFGAYASALGDSGKEARAVDPSSSAAAVPRPLASLRSGTWFKLICGASFQEVPAIRDLALVFTLAGADCIDVAADPAVIRAAREGVRAALALASWGEERAPWTMVSVNDGEDPHFRKAFFDAARCPADCPRPCERVCPADAIGAGGVLESRCYGCGRCVPVCPLGLVEARPVSHAPEALPRLLGGLGVDAVEIHTRAAGGGAGGVGRLWRGPLAGLPGLRLLAVSFQDDPALPAFLRDLHPALAPGPAAPFPLPLLLQADGMPMSGDVGAGKAKFAVALGAKARPPGPRPAAAHAGAQVLREVRGGAGGAAFGGYARGLVREQLEAGGGRLESEPGALEAAVAAASALVAQWKRPAP